MTEPGAGLMLIGASGLAREVLAVERLRGRTGPVAVLDDCSRTWGRQLGDATVLGGLQLLEEFPDDEVLVCVGHGTTRRALVTRLLTDGMSVDRFATSVHPQVLIPDGCTVGAGSIVLGGVVMTADVHVGEHVVVMPHVTLTHDDVVEDYATLCSGVMLGGSVRIGSGAYLGMGSAVREGLSVGRDATLGMGAVLVHSQPPDETWWGVPAHRSPTGRERA